MLFFDGGLAIIAFAVWLFCLIDVVTTPEGETRNLPKFVWLLIVILLLDIGSIAWLVAGRPWGAQRTPRAAFPGVNRRPSRAATSPDDDEDFLRQLKARAEEQRRRARDAQPREDDAD
jgi:hypothetical protein